MVKYTTPEMDVVLVSADDILMSGEQGGTGDDTDLPGIDF